MKMATMRRSLRVCQVAVSWLWKDLLIDKADNVWKFKMNWLFFEVETNRQKFFGNERKSIFVWTGLYKLNSIKRYLLI